jgi:hypothetical protein
MNSQNFRSLQEAYMEVVENQQLDEAEQSPMPPRRSAAERKKRAKELGDSQTIRGIVSGYNKKRQPSRQEDPEKYYPKEQYDLYDIILSHLLDEGYASTEEAATAIMVNMSEEWRDSVVEAYKDLPVDKMIRKAGVKQFKHGMTVGSGASSNPKVPQQVGKMSAIASMHDPERAKAQSKMKKD